MKKLIGVLLVMVLALVTAGTALAAEESHPLDAAMPEVSADSASTEAPAEFDFLRFAKERVLPDFHPTVKIEDAQADFDEKPYTRSEGITRAKIGIYYKGWLRQHSMLIEMDYRAEDRKVRVNVLKDTNGLNLQGARFFKDGEWVSIAAMGWK